MSVPRRKRPGAILVVALLVASLVLLSLPPPSSHGATPQVFDAVEEPLSEGPLVHKNQDLAQSFTPTVNYRLLAVELNLYDIGADDAVNFSLQTDFGGVPSGAILATGSANGPDTGYSWAPFNLSTSVDVFAAQTYWLVLEDGMNPGQGYRWAQRLGDPYPAGNYAVRGGGGDWTPVMTADLLFRTWGLSGPAIVAGFVVDSPTAGLLDPLTYTVFFNNSGTEAASLLWTNVTLSQNTTFESSTAPSVGGVPVAATSWMFADVPLGPHNYTVSVRVADNVFDGLPIVASVTVEYLNASGIPQEGTEASATVTARVPSIVVTKTTTLPFVAPGDNVTFAVTLVNSGSRDAMAVWANDTIPPELTYVGTNANALPSYSGHWFGGSALHVNLSNTPPGTYAFSVFTRANVGLANGTVITNRVDVRYTDNRGVVVPFNPTAAATVRIHGASIRVGMQANVGVASPGQIVTFTIRFDNFGNAVARRVWINDTLPGDLEYVSDTGGGIPSGSVVRFAFPDVPVGIHSLFLNARVRNGAADGLVLRNTAVLEYLNSDYTPLVPSTATADVRVIATSVHLNVTGANVADPGDLLDLTVNLTNEGSVAAPMVWVNVTLPPELAYVSDDAGTRGGVRTNEGWWFEDLTSGMHAFVVRFRVASGLEDNTTSSANFTADYEDGFGEVWRAATLFHVVTIHAPRFTFSIALDSQSVRVGESMDLVMLFTNEGSGAASDVWANVTMPSGVSVANASEPWEATTGLRFTWHWTSVTQGTRTIHVTLLVESANGGAGHVTARLTYTDANGCPHGSLTDEDTYEVSVPGWAAQTWGLLILLLLVGALSSFVGYKVYGVGSREKGRIDQLFLLHKSGVLIRHYSKTLSGSVDSDILAAMLVAVQNFVRDSFPRLKRGELEEMKFGQHNILLVHGQYTILAALVSGKFLNRIKNGLREAIGVLERTYEQPLKEWSGALDPFEGVEDVLDQVLQGRSPNRGARGAGNGNERVEGKEPGGGAE